jgi:hypothetical protein
MEGSQAEEITEDKTFLNVAIYDADFRELNRRTSEVARIFVAVCYTHSPCAGAIGLRPKNVT